MLTVLYKVNLTIASGKSKWTTVAYADRSYRQSQHIGACNVKEGLKISPNKVNKLHHKKCSLNLKFE